MALVGRLRHLHLRPHDALLLHRVLPDISLPGHCVRHRIRRRIPRGHVLHR